MGFFDKFKTPDYKSKDIEVRKRAVKDLTDESILSDIVNDDNEDYYVRAYALKNIQNENLLKNIVTNIGGYHGKFLKRLAFINIHDDLWLKEYFNQIEYDNLTQVALIRSIQDNSILQDFVFNSRPFINKKNVPFDVHINLTALENITDESILLNIVNNHFSIFIREKALLKIKDQKTLKIFAQDDSNRRLKIAAIRNPYLNDIDFLEAIKENEEDEEISKIIENRCNKQNLKNALITLYIENYEVCNQLLSKDDTFINEIIENNFNIQDITVGSKNTTQEVIDTAYNDINEYKRRDAVKEIYDKSILEDLMEKEIFDTVLMVIYSKLGKQYHLKDIALKGRIDGLNALKLINNPFILEDITCLKPYDSLGFENETRIKVLKRLLNLEGCLDFINEYTSDDTIKLIIFNKKRNRKCGHYESYRVVHSYNEMSEYLECHDCGKRTFL